MAVKSKTFNLKKHFVGLPREEDFEVVEKTLPPIADGEFLIESLYLSVDPYMRPYSRSMKEGTKMIGSGVGKVIESKSEEYPKDTIVTGPFGWTTHLVPDAQLVKSNMFRKVPPQLQNISYALGAVGLTGMTAYFGLLDVCQPKSGETVFVNSAAGATGSVVGQIAKIKGCRVVGCAGSDAKVEYLKEIGFDGAFNYKTQDLEKELSTLCPKGIDCFFDNVGGKMFDTTMKHMNRHGRIALCGCISSYNDQPEDKQSLGGGTGPYVHLLAIPKELKIQGFIVTSFYAKINEAITDLSGWIQEGKLNVHEHVLEGFETMPRAFMSLFQGENIGKVVVKM